MDYRKLYEKTFGIKIPRDYDIHHIDGDHNNNSLDNLLLLPRALHGRLHHAQDMFDVMMQVGDLKDFHGMPAELNAKVLVDLADVIVEVSAWMDAKYFEELRIDTGYYDGRMKLYEQFRTQ